MSRVTIVKRLACSVSRARVVSSHIKPIPRHSRTYATEPPSSEADPAAPSVPPSEPIPSPEFTPLASRDPESYYSWHSLQLSEALDIPSIPAPKPTSNTLVCTLKLRGFMPDHLDFVAYFARYSAHSMQLPTSDVIHLPVETKKWYVIKGPFVHGKTKEVFEKKTHVRCVQLYDASPESVQAWVDYVRTHLPSGIDIEVDRFEWAALPQSVDDATPTEVKSSGRKSRRKNGLTFEDEVRGLREQLLKKFTAGAVKKK
ncbi:ribosomal protein S10 domain-containing protein [Gaertneriomyces semiglobifer]|nr:ribosomal protein S10 domain-containing protein [Gaertneriomyces semiglobifer]